MLRRVAWRAGAAIVVAVPTVVISGSAGAQEPAPYRDPPFTCAVIDYGTEPPPVPGPPEDPLCVRYDKTNITVSTLGVIDFLAAEPGRVGVVAAKCSYWQQDHWIVRVAPDVTPVVEWDGSYWYDARTGSAAGILRGLRVGGQPVDGTAFIAALRPLVGDETADAMQPFTAEGGGGGAAFALPGGFGAGCGSPGEAPEERAPEPSPPAAPPAAGPDQPATGGADGRLPATGAAAPMHSALVLALAGATLAALGRRTA